MEEKNFTLKPCLIGTLFATVILIVATLVLSIVAKMTTAGESIIIIGTYITMFISGLCGGISAGKGTQKRGVVCGTIVGITLIILIKLFEIISTGGLTFDNGFYISALCIFISSVIGGVIGVN